MRNSEHPETTWRPSRRAVLGAVAASTAAAALPLAGTPSASAETRRELLYIGTWRGTQVNGAWFDPANGAMTPFGIVAQVNSSWQAAHASKPVLYVGSGDAGGTVSAFRIDRPSGALDLIGQAKSDSAGTPGGLSYIGIDRRSDTVLAANFAAGLTAAMPIRRDGGVDAPASVAVHTGSGPHPRQTGPHPHQAVVDPSGGFVLVPDLGADRVFIHAYDRRTRSLSGTRTYAVAPGSGPRRVVFHPGGRTLYLLNELSADLQTLDWNPGKGQITLEESLSIIAPDYTGTKSGGELGMSRDGRFLYATSRGTENAIVVYAIGRASGRLTLVQRVSSGGLTPWTFSIHRSGTWMLVANQVSSTVNLFSIDRISGKLTATGTSMSVPSPDCITFA